MSDTNQNNLPTGTTDPKLHGVGDFLQTGPDAVHTYGTSGVISPNKIDISVLTNVPDKKPERVNLLNEAADLVQGERQDDYGDPKVNFQRIADYWNTYLGDRVTQPLTWKEIGDMMILLKIARLANSSKWDTYVDIAGYSGITGGIAEEDSKNNG